MKRRTVIHGLLVTGAGSLAGCAAAGPSEPPTTTPTKPMPATPTQATGLGTIEYTVVNEDDERDGLEVTMANAEGRVVQETFEPEFGPGDTVSSGSAGEPPEGSPYQLMFRAGSATGTYRWDVRECGRIHLQVTITDAGQIMIDRDLCQN